MSVVAEFCLSSGSENRYRMYRLLLVLKKLSGRLELLVSIAIIHTRDNPHIRYNAMIIAFTY